MRRRHPGEGELRASFVPGPVRQVPVQQRRHVRKTAFRLVSWLAAAMLLGAPAVPYPLDNVAAQSSDQVHISVAPRIVAKAASELALVIELGPAHAVPPRSFVSLRGLPTQASLTQGHLVSPGLWAVPLSALPTLRAWIPADTSGQIEIAIRLIGLDGRLLAQATTALIIEPNPAYPPGSAKPAAPAPAVVARQPPPSGGGQGGGIQTAPGPKPGPAQLSSAERTRAEHLLTRGVDYLAASNVAAARDFFERAAEIGLAEAALRLAATYDPVELARLKAHGVVADLALARKWYERARDLGAPEAASQLARLGGGN
jgi:cell division septation protein DedD